MFICYFEVGAICTVPFYLAHHVLCYSRHRIVDSLDFCCVSLYCWIVTQIEHNTHYCVFSAEQWSISLQYIFLLVIKMLCTFLLLSKCCCRWSLKEGVTAITLLTLVSQLSYIIAHVDRLHCILLVSHPSIMHGLCLTLAW